MTDTHDRITIIHTGLRAAADNLHAVRQSGSRRDAESLAHQLSGLQREAARLAADIAEQNRTS